jgi:hypothetical protein
MRIKSLRLSLIYWLRQFPAPHSFLRAVYRALGDLFIGTLRELIPAGVPWGPPKGFFSEYELLQTGKLEGKVLVHAQDVPRAPADSLRHKCGLRQDGFQPWPIFWARHRNARLIASSLVLLDSQKRLSAEGAFGTSGKTDPAYRNVFLPAPTRLYGNWTSLTSRWVLEGYCHWFLDGLTRLALLPELPADTQIIVLPKLAQYQRQTLEWLGLQNRVRPTAEEHLLVENFYSCSPTAMTGCYDPFGIRFVRRSLLPHADLNYDPPPRFFLRRVGKTRGILNEKEVLDFFGQRGWAIIDTEQLPLAQQIRLFSRAEMICAPHGAGLTNLLWCPPGCKVLELCASTYLNGVYEGLSQCLGLSHRYLVFEGDNLFQSSINLAEVERALDF